MTSRRTAHLRAALAALAVPVLLATACGGEGIITEPREVPLVIGVLNAPVAGGFASGYIANRTRDVIRADVCDLHLEYRGGWAPQRWEPVVDDRLSQCTTGERTLAPGEDVSVRVPVPVLPGEYRLALGWATDDGRGFPTIHEPFAIAEEEALSMRLLTFANADTVRAEFHNYSSRPWTIDVCDGIRFEVFQLGRFYFADAGPRPEPCDIAPVTLHRGAVTLGVPLHAGMDGGRLRMRAGFVGPFGEIAVRWSGDFTVVTP